MGPTVYAAVPCEQRLVFIVDKNGPRMYDNGSNVNKLHVLYSWVATGL